MKNEAVKFSPAIVEKKLTKTEKRGKPVIQIAPRKNLSGAIDFAVSSSLLFVLLIYYGIGLNRTILLLPLL